MWRVPDPKSSVPLSTQIATAIRAAIAAGQVIEGERLPSVRALAAELRVNPNTVAKVYKDLERDGVVETRPGSGVSVAPGAAELSRDRRKGEIEAALLDIVARARETGLDDVAIKNLVTAALRADPVEIPSS